MTAPDAPSSGPTITSAQLRRTAVQLLVAGGAGADDADAVAEVLVWGDHHGRPNQGVKWLPTLLRRLAEGSLRSPAALTWHEAGAAASVLDAGDGFGQVAGCAAVDAAGALAHRGGIGAVAVRNSHHFGAAGAYAARAAAGGLVTLVFSNAYPKVAAHGGIDPVLGTNPLAFGCPTSGDPIIVDLATSATAGSNVRALLEGSGVVPETATLDPAGAVLRPAAGPKGTGLALAVEILTSALAGGLGGGAIGSMFATWDRPAGTSHLFVALDPARFGDLGGFLGRVDDIAGTIKGSRTAPGVHEVLVPGEARARAGRRSDRDGIALAPESARALEPLAAALGVELPWSPTSD